MAKNRYINTHFWRDTWVEQLSPSDKLLFLYLLTNPSTTIAGAYEIGLRQMALDTGFDTDMLEKMLGRFEDAGKIQYSNGWLLVENFVKHQSLNPKVKKGIASTLANCPAWIQDHLSDLTGDTPKPSATRSKVPTQTRRKVMIRDGVCTHCGASQDLEIDHIVPVCLGGSNDIENLRVLCQSCNGKRNAHLRWSDCDIDNPKSINSYIANDPTLTKEMGSLFCKMGSLSHLNSNLNINSNSNLNSNHQVKTDDDGVILFYESCTGNKATERDMKVFEELEHGSDICKIGIAQSILRSPTKINSLQYCVPAIKEAAGTGMQDTESYLQFLSQKVTSTIDK